MELSAVRIDKPADINFIPGVIDGMKSKGVETESDIEARKQLLRRFGYKFG